MPFPRGNISRYEPEDSFLEWVIVDGDIAGCVDTFIRNNGQLDVLHIATLKNCVVKINSLIELIDEGNAEFKSYAIRLTNLAQKVLAACTDK